MLKKFLKVKFSDQKGRIGCGCLVSLASFFMIILMPVILYWTASFWIKFEPMQRILRNSYHNYIEPKIQNLDKEFLDCRDGIVAKFFAASGSLQADSLKSAAKMLYRLNNKKDNQVFMLFLEYPSLVELTNTPACNQLKAKLMK